MSAFIKHFILFLDAHIKHKHEIKNKDTFALAVHDPFIIWNDTSTQQYLPSLIIGNSFEDFASYLIS